MQIFASILVYGLYFITGTAIYQMVMHGTLTAGLVSPTAFMVFGGIAGTIILFSQILTTMAPIQWNQLSKEDIFAIIKNYYSTAGQAGVWLNVTVFLTLGTILMLNSIMYSGIVLVGCSLGTLTVQSKMKGLIRDFWENTKP